jgi:hypothetical protein
MGDDALLRKLRIGPDDGSYWPARRNGTPSG